MIIGPIGKTLAESLVYTLAEVLQWSFPWGSSYSASEFCVWKLGKGLQFCGVWEELRGKMISAPCWYILALFWLYIITLIGYSILSFVVQSLNCVWLCNPMDCSMPGFPVHHQLPKLAQTHIHRVSDAIQPSDPLSPPSPHALNLSQHQGLFQ